MPDDRLMPDPLKVFPVITAENVARECAGPSDSAIDDPAFERCPEHPGGHLYIRAHNWCLHCFNDKP